MLPGGGRRLSDLIDCLLVSKLTGVVVRGILCCCVIIIELVVLRLALSVIDVAPEVACLQAGLVIGGWWLLFKVINRKIFIVLGLGDIHLA